MTLHAGIWTAPAPTALELLAPARDADAGIAAIDHGADAVYIGGPAFGARAAAGNSLDDIARLTAYAHRFNARVFLALNTLFTNEELPLARKLAFELADAGADVLILQDMGLLEGPLPDIELHASRSVTFERPKKQRFLNPSGSLSSCSRANFRSRKLPPSAPSFSTPALNSSCMGLSA